MADAVSGRVMAANPAAHGVGAFHLFGATGPDNSSLGWGFQVGVQKSTTEGNPAVPSLVLAEPGRWRFKWGVTAGTHTAAIYCKQVENVSPYPSMVIRANTAIGVNADVVGTSPGGAGWVTIGPITVIPSSDGVLVVELRNDLQTLNPARTGLSPWSPCYFDHIVLT